MSGGKEIRKHRVRGIPGFRRPPPATEEGDPIKRFAGLKRLRREWRA
jgi:hypothetical protein